MDYSELSAEEKELLGRYRELTQAKKEAIRASENAFIEWIKTSLAWLWDKISGYVRDLWNWFKGL